jgi:hypothetical protein
MYPVSDTSCILIELLSPSCRDIFLHAARIGTIPLPSLLKLSEISRQMKISMRDEKLQHPLWAEAISDNRCPKLLARQFLNLTHLLGLQISHFSTSTMLRAGDSKDSQMHVSQALAKMPNLKSLDLSCYSIGSWPENYDAKNLVILNLSACHVKLSDVKTLLGAASKLIDVNLEKIPLSDQDFISISNKGNIQTLAIYSSNISENIVDILKTHYLNLSTLKFRADHLTHHDYCNLLTIPTINAFFFPFQICDQFSQNVLDYKNIKTIESPELVQRLKTNPNLLKVRKTLNFG